MNGQRPNILLILTDQQRYDTLAAYGFEAGCTPNLDGVAQDGVVFERAYCTSPLCTPSRASMFTGDHLSGHGVERLYDSFDEERALFPEHLQRAGYRTALIGKLHVGSIIEEAERRHRRDGFDVYELCNEMTMHMASPLQAYSAWLADRDPEFRELLFERGREVTHYPAGLHMSHWAAERTVDFVRDAVADEVPFFAAMSLFDPHNPYDGAPEGTEERLGSLPEPRPTPDEALWPRGLRREAASKQVEPHIRGTLEEARRGYHASIAFLDEQIGRVLAELENQGVAENTLVIFTSDHGDMLGDLGLMTKGAFFYDPCVRVPLLMRWPAALSPRTRVNPPVQLNDIAATVLAAAGVDVDVLHADSRDLVALAREGVEPRPYAVSCYRNGGLNIGGNTTYFNPPLLATMLCTSEHKLVIYHDTEAEDTGQLFDLSADPGEECDLWSEESHREVREELTRLMLDWLVRDSWAAGPRNGQCLPASSRA